MLPAPWRPLRFAGIGVVVAAGFAAGLMMGAHPAAPTMPAPGVVGIQAAYDAERSRGSARHYNDLLIESANCNAITAIEYGCQVGYVRKSNVAGRLYFDVISVQRHGDAWALTGGLCRGPLKERSA